MGRSPCCDNKAGLKKGPWTPEEDEKLLAYIEEHGHGSWRGLPSKAGLQRCGKSCRLRWSNYLRPDIKRGKFTLQEEQTIIQLHALLGNRWSAIATHLPKRTDNEIKNYWNTHLKKRLATTGIDPITHKPHNNNNKRNDDVLMPSGDNGYDAKNAANLSHMAQWETARLEAEARLARQSKLRSAAAAAWSVKEAQSCEEVLGPTRCLDDVLTAWIGGGAAAGELESPTSTVVSSAGFLTTAAETSSCWWSSSFLLSSSETWDSKGKVDGERKDVKTAASIGGGGGSGSNDGIVDCFELEGDKNYWDNVLNLVTSLSPSHAL